MTISKTESIIRERYGAAAIKMAPQLCCPVSYDAQYLKVIPQEVLEKDYGCGDPSQHLKPGETVLDLGSGTGKICFIASQVVGPQGRVIGIDMTDAMLEVARRNAPIVAERVGYANVEFRQGLIQDLQPLIPSDSIDVVVSNCVLNLVDPTAKAQLFKELYRVLRADGRAVISDIVSNAPVPVEMQRDPELWTGCISGALREEEFLRAFETAGFRNVRLLKRDSKPWRVVHGIEFRAVTVEANKSDLCDSDEASCCEPSAENDAGCCSQGN